MMLDFRYRAPLPDESQDPTRREESPIHPTLSRGIWLPTGTNTGDKGNLLDNFGTRSE